MAVMAGVFWAFARDRGALQPHARIGDVLALARNGQLVRVGVMHFLLFNPQLQPNQAAYWFMMQIGMCLGFVTSYPMNSWLIRHGIKEAM